MAQAQDMAGEPSAPIVVSVQHPEKLSRLHLLLKTFFGFIYVGIPHGIILWALSIAAWVVSLAAFVVILFTGRYPEEPIRLRRRVSTVEPEGYGLRRPVHGQLHGR